MLTLIAAVLIQSPMSDAGGRWSDCINQTQQRYELTGESAEAVATATLLECGQHRLAFFETVLADRRSAEPDLDPNRLEDQTLEMVAKVAELHRVSITHYVVETRAQRTRRS